MNHVTYTLKSPVDLGGQTYESVTLREPTARDIEKANEGVTNPVTLSIKLVSIVAGIPQAAVREMTQSDFSAINELLGNFQDPSPETGES